MTEECPKLYFHAHGHDRLIAHLDGCKTSDDILDTASRYINDFCEEMNYKIPYLRLWNDYDRTWIDAGSHSEFFFVVPLVEF